MLKKFEIFRTKIKGSCQSGRNVVTHNFKSDLPLVKIIDVYYLYFSALPQTKNKLMKASQSRGSHQFVDNSISQTNPRKVKNNMMILSRYDFSKKRTKLIVMSVIAIAGIHNEI